MTFVSVFGNFSTKAPRSGQIELAPFNQIAQKNRKKGPTKTHREIEKRDIEEIIKFWCVRLLDLFPIK